MATFNLNISDDQVDRVINAFKELYPIPTSQDENTGEMVPDFTDAEWGKECVRKWVIGQVKRYEEMEAKKAINISFDDNLIS